MLTLPALPALAIVRRNLSLTLVALAIIVAADQFTKWLVVEQMNLREVKSIDFIPFLNFRMAWNTGVNFGFLSAEDATGRVLIIAFTTVLAAAIIAASPWSRRPLTAIGLGVAAGGAIGNLIDRFVHGAVADFINMSGFGIRNPWSFNIADIAIFAGFALLFWPAKKDAPASVSQP
jgi:signal peptidase II